MKVAFSHGRKALLTIYHDGVEQEKVELQQIVTEEEMYQMMLSKGFLLKSDEEVAAIKTRQQKSKDEEAYLKNKKAENIHQKREAIIEEQRHRAETFHGSTKGDELTMLTRRIQELKKIGDSPETVKELEQKRLELMRTEMLSRQHQIKLSEEIEQNQKDAAGTDEL